MAKSKEKNQALQLRQKGGSIKDIAKKLKIAKSTISLWCRDIKLSPEQTRRLHEKMIKGGYKGRMKGAQMQYENRLKREKESKEKGIKMVGNLSLRDLFIVGTALYWGEGDKKRRAFKITNSDPNLIKFILIWLKRIWKINNQRLSACVFINKIHEERKEEVENYWSKITGIPRKQFTKTILIKSKNKKNYSNFKKYYGTVSIKVKNPVELYNLVMGLIEGLKRGRLKNKL